MGIAVVDLRGEGCEVHAKSHRLELGLNVGVVRLVSADSPEDIQQD